MSPLQCFYKLNSFFYINNSIFSQVFELYGDCLFDVVQYGLMSKALDMSSVVEREAEKAVLCQTAGIKRASVQKRKEDKETMFRTEGLNIQANTFWLCDLFIVVVVVVSFYSVLWHCGLGNRKDMQSVNNLLKHMSFIVLWYIH